MTEVKFYMMRYCSYCKKQTEHLVRDSGDYLCTICGSVNINIQGIHMDLM